MSNYKNTLPKKQSMHTVFVISLESSSNFLFHLHKGDYDSLLSKKINMDTVRNYSVFIFTVFLYGLLDHISYMGGF